MMNRCNPNVRARCPDGKNCELYAEYTDGSWCDTFNDMALKQPMTNADRIRSMSDEELADFMNNHNVCDTRTNDQCKFNFLADCKECVLDWLRQPAEEVQSNA